MQIKPGDLIRLAVQKTFDGVKAWSLCAISIDDGEKDELSTSGTTSKIRPCLSINDIALVLACVDGRFCILVKNKIGYVRASGCYMIIND